MGDELVNGSGGGGWWWKIIMHVGRVWCDTVHVTSSQEFYYTVHESPVGAGILKIKFDFWMKIYFTNWNFVFLIFFQNTNTKNQIQKQNMYLNNKFYFTHESTGNWSMLFTTWHFFTENNVDDSRMKNDFYDRRDGDRLLSWRIGTTAVT